MKAPVANPAPGSSDQPALALDAVTVDFGGLHAVDDLTLKIPAGGFVGVVGPNGAGKSTLLQTINGFIPPTRGRIFLFGADVTGAAPERLAARGIGRTFQTSRVFPALSVLESVLVGQQHELIAPQHGTGFNAMTEVLAALSGARGYRARQTELLERAEAVMRLFGDRLWDRRNDPSFSLSYANRRRLDIARAIVSRPRVLLLDEPAAGMNPTETNELAQVLIEVRKVNPDCTVLMIEHKLKFVRELAERCIVMNQGRLVVDATPDEALSHPDVMEAYLGRSAATSPAAAAAQAPARGLTMERDTGGDAPVMRLDGIDVFYGQVQALSGLSLTVAPGQVVSVLGGNASGKSTTVKSVLGLVKPRRGTVHLFGEDVTGLDTPARIARRVASIPEGRRMFAEMTVEENLLLGAYARRGEDSFDQPRDLAEVFEEFPWMASRRRQLAGTLSGGEQQMVAMARAWMRRPRLLCVDEPSMGLSPAMVDRVYEILWRWKGGGLPILMVEQNARRAVELADHVYVLQNGAIVAEGPAETMRDDQAIRSAYLGG